MTSRQMTPETAKETKPAMTDQKVQTIVQKIEKHWASILAAASVITDYETLHAHIAIMIGSQAAAHHVLGRLADAGLANFQ